MNLQVYHIVFYTINYATHHYTTILLYYTQTHQPPSRIYFGEAESPRGLVDNRMGSSSGLEPEASASEICRRRVVILSLVFITLGALALNPKP